ncbi:MAG: dTDP-4-dehydrorhamnose reductase [Cryobacterium sp.]|jgi:dTDP-4-dehydrorhamnose reductase|nr:dTDP-4-dehydrorhamnose reductase [Cryobacterium sp.]
MSAATTTRPLQMWAGLECTINRTAAGYMDQGCLNGHDQRALADLEDFASLGIRTIRYPVLWERTAPDSLDQLDFQASDERLGYLRTLGIRPIVGLLHHGSGPRYTSLVDPGFPEKLAEYAGRVAERYPWAEHFTPVNEPLTTARFSGLYGTWFPHGRDGGTFARALYNEIKGTILSMRAIRRVNPSAQLVQTEDIGRTTGTEPLQYQVEFENERRWLSLDLLLGRVVPGHPLYTFLTGPGGIETAELDWLAQNPCPPDTLGVNHYPLSNRFLDDRVELYPESFHGGNGHDSYADVGAVDSGRADPPSVERVLRDVWERYTTQIAVTEAHIAGGRESQMRWLWEVWTAAERLRAEGAPLVAVTAWSLLGSFDWDTLCTSGAATRAIRYESGVFDVRWARPRPTALAPMIRSLAATGTYDHPFLDSPGYWHEPSRVLYAAGDNITTSPEAAPLPVERAPYGTVSHPPRPIVVVGASGPLGRAFSRVCAQRGIERVLLSRGDIELTSLGSIRACLDALLPWAVIDATCYLRVDEAESEPERCRNENTVGAQNLAAECARRGIELLTFSSEFVFDGTAVDPYLESHPVSPVNAYGHSKAEAERQVRDVHPDALVVRAGAFFGPWDPDNFMQLTLKDLRSGSAVLAAEDVTVSPTYVPDLVWSCLDLLADRVTGLIHIANKGALSWADWARYAAELAGADRSKVIGCSVDEFQFPARRPRYRVLESERVELLPSLEDALERFRAEIRLQEAR